MTMRKLCLWLLALLLLAAAQACDSDGDDCDSASSGPSIVGTFERLTENPMARQAEVSVVETTFYYNRIAALPDLSHIPACPAAEIHTAIEDHYFTIHPDYAYTEKVVHEQDGQSCLSEQSGTLNVDGRYILTDLGEEAFYEFRDDGQTLVIHARHEEVLPYEENLLATGNYDWVYGTWTREDEPRETLKIDKPTGDVRFDYLRYVRQDDESGPAIDAVCGFTVHGRNPRLFQHEMSNEMTMEFTVHDVNLREGFVDSLDCAYYVIGLDNMIMENGLEHQFEVDHVGDNLVIDDRAAYHKAQ